MYQIYVGAALGKFGPTQPLTTNLPSDLLSFFNFLLSLQPLAWRVSCSNQFKQEKVKKVKTELQLRQQKQTAIWLSPGGKVIKFSVGQILREINLCENTVTQYWRVSKFGCFWEAKLCWNWIFWLKIGLKWAKIKFWKLEIDWKWNFGPSYQTKTAILTILEPLNLESGNFHQFLNVQIS